MKATRFRLFRNSTVEDFEWLIHNSVRLLKSTSCLSGGISCIWCWELTDVVSLCFGIYLPAECQVSERTLKIWLWDSWVNSIRAFALYSKCQWLMAPVETDSLQLLTNLLRTDHVVFRASYFVTLTVIDSGNWTEDALTKLCGPGTRPMFGASTVCSEEGEGGSNSSGYNMHGSMMMGEMTWTRRGRRSTGERSSTSCRNPVGFCTAVSVLHLGWH